MNTQKLKPFIIYSPGEILSEEFAERKISSTDFAKIINQPLKIVDGIISGKEKITPKIASTIATVFGTSQELWLGLQNDYK